MDTVTTAARSRRTALTVLAAALVLQPLASAASASTEPAADGPTVRVEDVVLEPDGTSELVVSVSGLPPGVELTADVLTVAEDGVPVPGLVVTRPGGASDKVPAVVVAIDTSGSTQGEPLEQAVAASDALLTELDANGVLTGVLGFGEEVTVLARPGDGTDRSRAALQGLTAAGSTSLYDAVARAARLLAEHDGPRDVVVFSDGVDTASATGLDAVRQLAADAEVRVTAVALDSGELDVAPLQAIATATGGQVITVADPAQLLAVFADVAADLTSRYVLRWQAEPVPVPPTQLAMSVQLQLDGVVSRADFVALSSRTPAITPPVPWETPRVWVQPLTGTPGLVVFAVTLFGSVLILAALMFGGAGERRRREQLASRLAAWDGLGDAPDDAVQAAASLSSRAADVVDRIPRPKGAEERLTAALERADWPMRSSEFLLVTAATAFAGLVVPLALLGNLALAVLLLLLGAAAPTVVLRVAIRRRMTAFNEQLPQVLLLLAGALRAGHGVSTALEGAVRESSEPARTELRRATVEARLGRPVSEALRGVAHRLRSDELLWVVNAMAVQQEVGGNLAELLDNVAATLRDRASLGRTVKALTAEGRMSAWIIGVMPIAMFVFLTIFNPDYVEFFYADPRGWVLLGFSVVMLAIGGAVLRKLVQPRY